MAKTSLLPGFRFHPTAEELVMFYLKRKLMRMWLPVAIAEVNIYKFSPWDLPDKSCLKNKDLEWFFFCPRENKYASGVRVKRATENGYWKTTGKDRPVHHKGSTVGMVKTLVFHKGHVPQGERTDWVIHEYRISDDKLDAAVVQDLYVLCKLFKKSGLGPKNGAQYGAPFNEDDWADGDIVDTQNPVMTFSSANALVTASVLPDVQSISTITGMVHLGRSGPSNNEVPVDDSMDEMPRILASLTDDSLTFDENGNHGDDHIGNGKDIALRNSDGNDMYDSLGDLDCGAPINEFNFGPVAGMDSNALNSMRQLDDLSYIELDDLGANVEYSSSDGHQMNDLLGDGKDIALRNSDGNEMYDCLGDLDFWAPINEFNFGPVVGMDSNALNSMRPLDDLSYIELDDFIPEGANVEYSSSDGHQMVNDQFYGVYTAIGFNSTCGQPENVGDFTQDLGSGRSDGI